MKHHLSENIDKNELLKVRFFVHFMKRIYINE